MDQLAKYLTKHKLSQKEFAELLGVSPPLVCQWLAGRRRPDLTHALEMEKATGGEIPVSAWAIKRRKSA